MDESASWDVSSVPAEGARELPAELGPYRVVGPLGRGGFGLVLRALDPAGREVAIKLLTASKADKRSRDRFLREAELTAALRHPGIVRVHACGEVEAGPWIAYELVEGGTLEDLIESREDVPRVLSLIVEVARALGVAHREGIVHRDIKPENILLDAEGRARVADFGLARGVELERLTRTGEVLGTPLYMSPEQLRGKPTGIGPHTDVWALGVLLYQALTGETPFPATTLPELLGRVIGTEPVPPRELDPSVSPALEAVCLRALAKEARDRYPGGDELAEALSEALAGGGGASAATGRPIAFALVLLLVGSAAWFGWGQREPPTPSTAGAVAPPPAPAAPVAPPPSDPSLPVRPSLLELVPAAPEGELAFLSKRRDEARGGEPEALYELGRAYAYGWNGLAVDRALGLALTREAAERGQSRAMVYVGDQLADAAESFRWYRRAADEGNELAFDRLGRAYRDGRGVARDLAQAEALFRKGLRNKDAQADLAELLLARGGAKDLDEAVDLAWTVMERGRPGARALYLRALQRADGRLKGKHAIRLARFKMEGEAVEPDLPGARDLLLPLAQEGVTDARRALAELFEFPWVVAWQSDLEFVELPPGFETDGLFDPGAQPYVRWFQELAGAGDAAGQSAYGNCLRNGWGVGEDLPAAQAHYQKAAEQGHLRALYWYAAALWLGYDGPPDRKAGLPWLIQAAEAGDAPSMFRLAFVYEGSFEDLPADPVLARRWLRAAAAAGHPEAAGKLGWLLTQAGQLEAAVPFDLQGARAGVRDCRDRLARAAARGVSSAKRAVAELED